MGRKSGFFSASMEKRIEGAHTELLKMITGKRTKLLGYGTWETLRAEGVREVARTQLASIHIEQRKATMAQLVALRPLFGVCSRETRYGGGGRRKEAWWCQEVTGKQLLDTLVYLREAKRMRIIGGEMGMQ